VFEDRVLRKTFGPKKQEVTGGWRSIHDEEHSSPNTIKVIKTG
jgi:hypothetical protein